MKTLIRIDDREVFIQLPSGMYVIKRLLEQYPDSFHFQWTYEQLMQTGGFEEPK